MKFKDYLKEEFAGAYVGQVGLHVGLRTLQNLK